MMFLGFVIGFLFGIPKSHAGDQPSTANEPKNGLVTNTNLEQISDWLTKIRVGVGLTQIKQISAGVWQFAKNGAPAFADAPAREAFVVTLILYFVLCGFLSGYIWTRMFLAGAFSLADKTLSGETEKQKASEPLQDAPAG